MLEWVSELAVEARLKAIDRAFEKLGSTDDGMMVLAVLLDDLCFFGPCGNEKEQAWNEYAKVLLKRCGRNLGAQAVSAWANVFGKDVVSKEKRDGN